MHHVSVRIVLISAVLLATSESAGAQFADDGSRRLRGGIALGVSIPSGYRIDVPGDFGLHAQLSAAWYRSAAFAWRVDALAQSLAGAAAEPSCIPGAVCTVVVPHPNQVYSATLSAQFRPIALADGLYAVVGAGAYHGRGPSSTSFGTTAGGVFGLGGDLTPPARSGFALEMRYHYLPNTFGRMTGLLTPSVMFRF